ncbi:acyl-ACP thioesterase domain-containing protein [Desulforamulus ruminis]|uniref:acyl-ACP thioesterase domain-containing protein n=2 Tax=Desulforamulus ruminis TaxID=1564 RepID=UPI0023541353|nr:acyl-ACP thioesterase domain-containing protein [Desulforamulus ruminis]
MVNEGHIELFVGKDKIMERDYIYEINNELSDLNQNNILKPYGYQKLFGQVVDWHLNKINLKMDMTMKYNLAWAFVSLAIEIIKPVEGITKMYAQTWHSQRKGPFFRREFVFKNENGEILFRGASFSILLDTDKRTIYRKKELPFVAPELDEDFTIEASPTININSEFKKVDERKVYNSYIDCLGHVNNIRYGEFAYDAFSEAECVNLCNLKRMDLYFRSELKNNDMLSILKVYENSNIMIQGYNNTKSNISFDIIFKF